MNHKFSLIFCTCDKYKTLWNGFFTLWHKYWPEFDALIVLNTETENYSFPNYEIIRPEFPQKSLTWSYRLYTSLMLVKTPYILLSLDDFYLKSPVDNATINACISQMDEDESIKLFTFGWQPGANEPCDFNKKFEKRGRFAPYRVNAQIGLWRVSYLKKIIKLYENPWEFELNGSFRSSISGGKLFSLKKSSPLVFDYDWGFLIVRGQINREVADYFEEKEGITFDASFKDIDMENYSDKGKKGWWKTILTRINYLFKMLASLFKS